MGLLRDGTLFNVVILATKPRKRCVKHAFCLPPLRASRGVAGILLSLNNLAIENNGVRTGTRTRLVKPRAADAFGLMAIAYEEPSRKARFNQPIKYPQLGIV